MTLVRRPGGRRPGDTGVGPETKRGKALYFGKGVDLSFHGTGEKTGDAIRG